MINVDLTKMFHPRSFELLAPFLPGFFFEGSLLVGRPELVRETLSRVGSERYLLLFLALLAAFVVGSALLLWVRLMEIVLWRVCSSSVERWPKIIQWLITSSARRKHTRVAAPAGLSTRPSRIDRWLGWANFRAHRQRQELDHVLSAWWKATGVVLRRLGIDDPGDHIDAWAGTVGGVDSKYRRSALLVMALNALGWGGLVARRIAPELGWLHRDLCFFLIFIGMLSDCSVAWDTAHPARVWRMSLQNVLDELRKSGATAAAGEKAEHDGIGAE